MKKNYVDLSVEQDAVGDLIEMFQKIIDNLKTTVSILKNFEDNEYAYRIEFGSQQITYLKKYKRELMKRWNEIQKEFDNEKLFDHNE